MTAASGLAAENPARASADWVAELKDAGLAALAATLLALPLMGFQTYDVGGGALGVRTRFDWVAVAAAAVFAGRLMLRICHRLTPRRESRSDGILASLAASTSRLAMQATLAGLVFAVALPFLPFSSRYLTDLGTTVLIYVMLAGGSMSSLGWPAFSILATSRSTRWVPTLSLCWRAILASPSGRHCRFRA